MSSANSEHIGDNEVDPGCMVDVTVYGPKESHYLLMNGTLREEPNQFQVLTRRGGNRENAGTRIPLRISPENVRFLATEGATDKERRDFWSTLDSLASRNPGKILQSIELLLIKMPRPGNKRSGLELDAPGGGGEPGETGLEVSGREFSEEAEGLRELAGLEPFPEWLQFSAGAYDEVQHISFTLVGGEPGTPTEGGKAWATVHLDRFTSWVEQQNSLASGSEFTPVGGKVVLAVLWLIEKIKNRCKVKCANGV